MDAALDAFNIDSPGFESGRRASTVAHRLPAAARRGARGRSRRRSWPVASANSRGPTVTVRERFHVRDLKPDAIDGCVDLVVADLSFISIIRVLAHLIDVAHPLADMVLLVKPQFEAGKAEVDRGSGVIRDPAIHRRVRDDVAAALRDHGCDVVGWVDSPITGAQGNREFPCAPRRSSGSAP